MQLELANFRVSKLEWGQRTALGPGTLLVNADEIIGAVTPDPCIAGLRLDIAEPGSSTRVIHVLDVVEPRYRLDERSAFPGMLGAPVLAGAGRALRLAMASVIVAAEVRGETHNLPVKEAIIDMSGPGAAYSRFSQTHNLIVTFELREEFSVAEQVKAVRTSSLQIAEFLGSAVADGVPDDREVFELSGDRDGRNLPRVVYVCPLMHVGDIHSTYLYGVSMGSLPSLLHPNEVLDGAIVTGDYLIAAQRVATYDYQNNPIIRDLYRRDGDELSFIGVVIAPVLSSSDVEKERCAQQVAKLCRMLGADGAIFSMQSGGHGYADLMMMGAACEQMGTKTVLMMAEMADKRGADDSLLVHMPEVDAIVSTGNMDAVVALPEMERVLGGTAFLEDPLHYEETSAAGVAREGVGMRRSASLRQLYASCSQVGASTITGRTY